MTTYVHKFNRTDRLYQVGYFSSEMTNMDVRSDNIHFHCLEEFGSIAEAAAFINYLNGGEGKRFNYGD